LEALTRRVPLIAIASIAVIAALALPAQASAAWKLRFVGDFNHGINTRVWTRYDGTPRCCHETLWKKSHVVVKGGLLRLQNYRDPAFGGRWVSAGVSMGRSLNQTYGKYQIRFLMTKGRGVGMCLFLWPQHGWPPEIDFAEESSAVGSRRSEMATLHFGSHNTQIRHTVRANFQTWHTIGVNWRPGMLTFTLDGHRWSRITGRSVPHVPMHLGMQTHVGSNGVSGPSPSSVTPAKVGLKIDWVKIWRWA